MALEGLLKRPFVVWIVHFRFTSVVGWGVEYTRVTLVVPGQSNFCIVRTGTSLEKVYIIFPSYHKL